MNIKGNSRIRISRIYSDRGQTVWSCHPQFGEDIKTNYLQKKQFLPKSILMLCKLETMHSSWSMFGASQIGFRYWTLRVSGLQPHCLLLIGVVDWGSKYREYQCVWNLSPFGNSLCVMYPCFVLFSKKVIWPRHLRDKRQNIARLTQTVSASNSIE